MCWSGEASTAIAAGSLAVTVYCYQKGESKALVGVLFYFTLMEALQAYTYTVIDECNNPQNITATYLAYIHVSLQPIIINILTLHFIPEHTRLKIQSYVYAFAALMTITSLIRILPLEWAQYCYQVTYHYLGFDNLQYQYPFCGTKACTISGDWHMAWQIPAGYNYWLDRSYLVGVFLLPFVYGSWRIGLYCGIIGPGLAFLLTDNANEFAAVFCMLSIAIISSVIITPIRKVMHVQSWYGTPWFGFKKEVEKIPN